MSHMLQWTDRILGLGRCEMDTLVTEDRDITSGGHTVSHVAMDRQDWAGVRRTL